MVLDLTGIHNTDQYSSSIFPGGEIYFALKAKVIDPVRPSDTVHVHCRIDSANTLMLLTLAVDTIRERKSDITIIVYIHYIPYQQADRPIYNKETKSYECFGMRVAARVLNTLDVNMYVVTDPHSDVAPALIKNCTVISNASFINEVLAILGKLNKDSDWTIKHNLTVLTPDAGAYKKIFKLCGEIPQLDDVVIESANKFRDTKGEFKMNISTQDFRGRDILVIDDIALGGRTFVELIEQVRTRNIGKCYLAVSNGIFNNGFLQLFDCFSHIFTTNAWQTEDKIREKLIKDGLDKTDFVHVLSTMR